MAVRSAKGPITIGRGRCGNKILRSGPWPSVSARANCADRRIFRHFRWTAEQTSTAQCPIGTESPPRGPFAVRPQRWRRNRSAGRRLLGYRILRTSFDPDVSQSTPVHAGLPATCGTDVRRVRLRRRFHAVIAPPISKASLPSRGQRIAMRRRRCPGAGTGTPTRGASTPDCEELAILRLRDRALAADSSCPVRVLQNGMPSSTDVRRYPMSCPSDRVLFAHAASKAIGCRTSER
jgi:hypothetical protein